jgi:hypothetical protein
MSMHLEQGDLGIRLQADPDVDNQELAEITARLRNDDVLPETASGDAPADSKGVALGPIGCQQDPAQETG